MMARSGGFNVPADYFRSSAMPPPVPASPSIPKQRWPLYAVIAAVCSGLGVVAMVLVARGGGGTAHATPTATVTAPVTATATATAPPTATVAPAATATATPAPQHEVLVSVFPADATLTRDGQDLGGAPVALHLADGEGATIVVARKGYKTKTVTIESNDTKVAVALEGLFGPAPKTGAGPAPKPATGGIDDVGDPFKKH
jgi:serine/threonine-protein kinase